MDALIDICVHGRIGKTCAKCFGSQQIGGMEPTWGLGQSFTFTT